jgi:ApaG protein
MSTAITEGIKISVRTKFRDDLSCVEEQHFFFNYHIEIENHNSFAVQLLQREWFIFDSLQDSKQISGTGVIGEQPILKSSEQFCYDSGCELNSEIGYMRGQYTFINLFNGKIFLVDIPMFNLTFPPFMN